MIEIAVQPDVVEFGGTRESYSDRWMEIADGLGVRIRPVNVYQPDIIQQVRGCEGFLWRTVHAPGQKAVAKRLLPVLEHMLGGCVFPDVATYWHYDDKIAQKYLLEAAGIPIPHTWVFWTHKDASEFLDTARFPLVLKLYGGAGAANVRLLRDRAEAASLLDVLFSGGVFGLDHAGGSQIFDTKKRFRGALKLLLRGQSLNPGSWWELHKNYVLLQEFLAGNTFDTRVTVIGNRAFGFRRYNRPEDFRASGSGRVDLDPTLVGEEFVRLAFRTAAAVGTQAVAIDGMYKDGEPVVGEISYTFVSNVVHACPGHWELNGSPENGQLHWVDGPMRAEDAILADLLSRIESRRSTAAGLV